METTPQAKINKYALNIFDSVKDFEKFLHEVYGHDDEYIKARGFYPSIDNVAIDGILWTMDEYDNDGQQITFGNKRTGQTMSLDTSNRYKNGYGDATVIIYEAFGFRNDINYLD
jgi:hypothetical protein